MLLHDFSSVFDDDALISSVYTLTREVVDSVVGVDRRGPDTLNRRCVGLLHSDEIARLDIGLLNGGDIHHKDLCGPVGITTYGLVSVMSGIGELVTPRLVGSCEHKVTLVVVQFEVGMQL